MLFGLSYSIIIEKTEDPNFFGVVVPDILGCTTTGRSIQECIHKAREAIELHLQYLQEEGLSLPPEPKRVYIKIVEEVEETAEEPTTVTTPTS